MRPVANPALLPALTDAVPQRVRKRLDATPGLANTWAWAEVEPGWSVTTDTGETVSLRPDGGVVQTMEQLHCTCLLAPRCLHLLAVVSALAVHEQVEPPSTPAEAPVAPDAPASAEQITAAQHVFAALTQVLTRGATGVGPVLQSDLLRAVRICTDAGLPRLGAGLLRLYNLLRAHAAFEPWFRADLLTVELAGCLKVARAVQQGQGGAWIGLARREYLPAGNLRLYGVCSEAVLTAGYAGVSTLLVNRQGRFWSLADVLPGGAERLRGAYEGNVRLGELLASHRKLGREGVFIHDATASVDGRLGAGEQVSATRGKGLSWAEEPLSSLFQQPLVAQVRAALAAPEVDRPAGAGLLFLTATVVGASEASLILKDGEGRLLRCDTASDAPELAFRDNLRLLVSCPGLPIQLIARPHPALPRRVIGIAAALDTRLPDTWMGRCNLGLDWLQRAWLDPREHPPTVALPEPFAPDPLAAPRRRLHRAALGGVLTLGASTLGPLAQEAAALERAAMGTGATLLRGLGQASCPAVGRRNPDPLGFAEAWLAGMVWLEAAERQLLLEQWE